MKVVILAAGYGARLQKELTALSDNDKSWSLIKTVWQKEKGVAKALIPIQGKPLVQHLVEQLGLSGFTLNDIFVVMNELFYQWFLNWANNFGFPADNLINDKTACNELRLGSNSDLAIVIKQKQIADDLLIIAGDTLFKNLDLKKFLDFCSTQGHNVITYYEESWGKMTKHGNLIIKDGFLTGFVEKPAQPISNFAFPSLNLIKKDCLPLLAEFIKEVPELSKNDGHGFFIQWLLKQGVKIAAYQIPGRFDLGTLADWQLAEQQYQK